jgi:hypothetical protein
LYVRAKKKVGLLSTQQFAAGEVVGTLDCIDPDNGEARIIIALSGPAEAVSEMYTTLRSSLPADYVFASPEIAADYWAGKADPRFRPGRNADGSKFSGDSVTCVEPRLYQCARHLGWSVRGMTLIWRGNGSNPFPAEARSDDNYMRPCPSCASNVGALLDGVKMYRPE